MSIQENYNFKHYNLRPHPSNPAIPQSKAGSRRILKLDKTSSLHDPHPQRAWYRVHATVMSLFCAFSLQKTLGMGLLVRKDTALQGHRAHNPHHITPSKVQHGAHRCMIPNLSLVVDEMLCNHKNNLENQGITPQDIPFLKKILKLSAQEIQYVTQDPKLLEQIHLHKGLVLDIFEKTHFIQEMNATDSIPSFINLGLDRYVETHMRQIFDQLAQQQASPSTLCLQFVDELLIILHRQEHKLQSLVHSLEQLETTYHDLENVKLSSCTHHIWPQVQNMCQKLVTHEKILHTTYTRLPYFAQARDAFLGWYWVKKATKMDLAAFLKDSPPDTLLTLTSPQTLQRAQRVAKQSLQECQQEIEEAEKARDIHYFQDMQHAFFQDTSQIYSLLSPTRSAKRKGIRKPFQPIEPVSPCKRKGNATVQNLI